MTLTTRVAGAAGVVDRFYALGGSTAVSKLDVVKVIKAQDTAGASKGCRSYMERRYLIPVA